MSNCMIPGIHPSYSNYLTDFIQCAVLDSRVFTQLILLLFCKVLVKFQFEFFLGKGVL